MKLYIFMYVTYSFVVGQTYKLHKKMIQPLFSLEFSTECVGVFERHMKMCVDKLEGLVGRKYFNIEEVIHKCTADIIGGNTVA